MKRKDTDDLRQELSEVADLSQFLRENDDSFDNASVAQALSRLFSQKSITKSALAKQASMSEVYLHQIFAGRRTPSRDRLLCLCFGLSASIDEAQYLLKQCGLAQLYPHNKRDAVISYGLLHSLTLFEINDRLFSEDLDTLC